MIATKTDWIGQWYRVAKERGVNDQCCLSEVNLKTGREHKHRFSHAEHDGAGAFVDILRKRGAKSLQVPESREQSPPKWYRRPLILWQALQAMKSDKIPWKFQDRSVVDNSDAPISWATFSKEETQTLANFCREKGFSQNALFLKFANQTLLQELLQDNFTGSWLFPVNMRGPVWQSHPLANHSSGIYLKTDWDSSARELHQQIRSKLKGGLHWGVWWIGHIGKLVGINGMRYLSKNSAQKSYFFGTFSNMGAWHSPSEFDPEPDTIWYGATPGTPNYPIGLVALIWNGRLTLSLKIHPSILPDQKRVDELLAKYKDRLLRTVS